MFDPGTHSSNINSRPDSSSPFPCAKATLSIHSEPPEPSERLFSPVSSPTTLAGSEDEPKKFDDSTFASSPLRSSPHHQPSQTSRERFDTPEPEPSWASSPAPASASSDSPARPAYSNRVMRSEAGRRWQRSSATYDPPFATERRHHPHRSVSSQNTSAVPHRALISRRPSSPLSVTNTMPLRNARAQSTTSATVLPHHQRPSLQGLFNTEQHALAPEDSWFADHLSPGSWTLPPTSSSNHWNPPTAFGDATHPVTGPSPRSHGRSSSTYSGRPSSPAHSATGTNVTGLSSLADARSMNKIDLFLLASKNATELETATRRFAIERDALLDALSESRKMCQQLRRLCECELGSSNGEAAEQQTRMRVQIKQQNAALLEMREELAHERERVEALEVENSRLETRANAMANELKRAVVDLRSASSASLALLASSSPPLPGAPHPLPTPTRRDPSRLGTVRGLSHGPSLIPRAKPSTTPFSLRGETCAPDEMLDELSGEQQVQRWRTGWQLGTVDDDDLPLAEPTPPDSEPDDEEASDVEAGGSNFGVTATDFQDSGEGSEVETETERAMESPTSTVFADYSEAQTGADVNDEDEWIASLHNRDSVSNCSMSGDSAGWRLKPEDELFLQDLDEDEFVRGESLAGGSDEEGDGLQSRLTGLE